MTNYERIKRMSREELVRLLSDVLITGEGNCGNFCFIKRGCRGDGCEECMALWMDEEAEDTP